MVEYLPDAETKPKENVLFVCKLNPRTESEDLKEIFSQCGKVVSCHVVRDWKTNKSLLYAFVEFEEKASAEEAFLKLQHCIIDNRRVEIDFSQSVSRQWNKFREEKVKREKKISKIHGRSGRNNGGK